MKLMVDEERVTDKVERVHWSESAIDSFKEGLKESKRPETWSDLEKSEKGRK